MIFLDLQYDVLLVFSCSITSILVVWYLTSAFVEYSTLLGLRKILLVDRYEEYLNNSTNYETTYPQFLKIYSDSFLFKILECHFCLGLWLSIICCIKIGFVYLPVLYLISVVKFLIVKKISQDHNLFCM